jgi:hypothetical protein
MSLWKKLVLLLDRREAATSMALVRIASGLTVSAHLLHLGWTGAHRLVWADFEYGGLRDLKPGWLEYLGGLTAGNIEWVMGITALAGLLMALGLGGRAMTLAVFLGYDYLADLNGHAGGSYDELIKNTIFAVLLSGAYGDLTLLRAWKKLSPERIPAWPRWLLIFQLVLMYWMTAIQKVSSSWVPWGELDALWYILQQPTWQRFPLPMQSLTWAYPLTQAASLSVWAFEQAAPLLLLAYWYRETRERPGYLRARFNALDFRTLYLLFGVGMHIGIEALMEVGPFSIASLTLYLACFHPDEWSRLFNRLRMSGSSPVPARL